MAHKFDPKNLERLEAPKRLKIFEPSLLFQELSLKNFNTILDFGVGTGFYLPYLVNLLTPLGKVYAIDVQRELFDYAKEKCQKLGLTEKVEFKLIEEERPLPFEEGFFDFIYLAFTFHELKDPDFALKEMKRVLKPEGKLLLIDWNKKEREMGPPPQEVFSFEEIHTYLERASFKIIKALSDHPYVFIFLAEK